MFPDNVESFQTSQKSSILAKNPPPYLKSCQLNSEVFSKYEHINCESIPAVKAGATLLYSKSVILRTAASQEEMPPVGLAHHHSTVEQCHIF